MRRHLRLAIGALALAGCSGGAAELEETLVTTTTKAPVDVTAETQLMALEATWSAEEVCPPWRKAVATGIDYETLTGFAVRQFAEGFGEALEPATEARLLELLAEC